MARRWRGDGAEVARLLGGEVRLEPRLTPRHRSQLVLCAPERRLERGDRLREIMGRSAAGSRDCGARSAAAGGGRSGEIAACCSEASCLLVVEKWKKWKKAELWGAVSWSPEAAASSRAAQALLWGA